MGGEEDDEAGVSGVGNRSGGGQVGGGIRCGDEGGIIRGSVGGLTHPCTR